MRAIPPENREELEKLERKHAENPEGRYFVPLANALRKAGEFYRAKALLREGLGRYPDYVSAHIVLGRCLQDEGSRGEAEFRFRHVLTLDPQNLVALRTLGEIAAAAGRVEEARSWYRELLVVDPMNEEARLALDELPPEPPAEEEADGVAAGEAAASAVSAEATGKQGIETAFAGGGEGGAETLEGTYPADGTSSEVEAGEGAPAPAETEELAVAGAVGDVDAADTSAGPEDIVGSAEDQGITAAADATEETVAASSEEVVAGAGPDDGGESAGEGAADQAVEEPAGEEEQAVSPRVETESAWQIEEMYLFGAAGTMLDLDSPPPAAPEELYGREDALATETLAELYTRQGFFDRAARVYRELIRRRGSDARLQEKLARVERLAAGEEDPFADSFAGGFPAESTTGPEGISAELYADAAEEETPPAQSIRDYLRDILSWAPASARPDAAPAQVAGASSGADAEAAPSTWKDLEAGDAGETSVAGDETDSLPERARWEEPTVELREGEWEDLPIETDVEAGSESEVEAEPWASSVDTERVEGAAADAPPPVPEDDLFPWELPPSPSTSSGSPPPSAPAWPASGETAGPPVDRPADSGNDAEPSEPPTAAAGSTTPEGSGPRPGEPATPGGGGPASEPSTSEQEDDDLESFQAWLRSLRR